MKPTDVSAVVDQQRHSARTQRSNQKAFSADAALLPPHPDQSWMPELHIADPGTAEVRGEHADDYDRRSRVFCRTSPRTQPFRRPRTPPLFLNNPPVSSLRVLSSGLRRCAVDTHARARARVHPTPYK